MLPDGFILQREGSSKKIKKQSKLDKVESRFSVTLKGIELFLRSVVLNASLVDDLYFLNLFVK